MTRVALPPRRERRRGAAASAPVALVAVLGLVGCPGDDTQISSTSGESTSSSTGSGPVTVTAATTTTQGTTVASSSSGDTIDLDTTAGETTVGPTSGTTDPSTTSVGTDDGGTSSGSSGSSSGGETGIEEQGYGDCFNNLAMDVCLMGEECIDDGGMPPGVGVCAYQGCAGAGSCPQPPPGGTATPGCIDVTGDLVDECVLECGGGATCPTGMACFADFVCVWSGGLGPGDFACANDDLGSATGAAVATGSTVGQGNDFAPGCVGPNGEDVHLVWTALAAGTYTFDTIGSSYDTILYVLEDCVGMELGCNDDTMMLLSEVTVDLQAGQSVLVIIDGYGNSSGNYVLNVN